jgi:hypothetical protein
MPRRTEAQLRSGLLTVPGLPELWTRKQTRAHKLLGRRQTNADVHSPLGNRHTDAGFPHRQQAAHHQGTCYKQTR